MKKRGRFPIAFPPSSKHYTHMILLKNFYVNTSAEIDVISVIHEVNRAIRESQIHEGTVNVITPAAGAGITIIELLPQVVEHFREATRIFPGEGVETKNRRKEDIAVSPRVRAAMLGKFVTVPVSAGRLVLGPREEIVLVDFEPNAKRREFVVQLVGEAPEQKKAPPPRRR